MNARVYYYRMLRRTIFSQYRAHVVQSMIVSGKFKREKMLNSTSLILCSSGVMHKWGMGMLFMRSFCSMWFYKPLHSYTVVLYWNLLICLLNVSYNWSLLLFAFRISIADVYCSQDKWHSWPLNSLHFIFHAMDNDERMIHAILPVPFEWTMLNSQLTDVLSETNQRCPFRMVQAE